MNHSGQLMLPQNQNRINQFIIMLPLIAILLALATPAHPKPIPLAYNPALHTLTLFTARGDPVLLVLTFDSPDLSLHQSLKSAPLYLQKNHKHKLDAAKYAKYDFKTRGGSVEESPMGRIGLREGSAFFSLLKLSLSSEVKLEVRHREGVINVVQEPCRFPLFPPLQLTLSQAATHTYTIEALSTGFIADSSLLKIVGKDRNPFEVPASAIDSQLTLSVRDRVVAVSIRELFVCGKYANSESYECQANTKGKADLGGLLLYFDPFLCSSGLQLHRSMDDSWGFHYSHLALLLLQFLLLGLLVQEERVLAAVRRLLGRSKQY